MAAEILLEINGHKYNASGFSYDFYQVPDFKGKSVTGIKGGDIHVVLDSSYDNSILETMLSDKTRKVPCVPWEEYEPCPVSGRIQFVQDDVHVFRELAFEEAYITRYKEKMDANGYPMSILLTISTLRLDINKFVRMDRRPETTYGFGWVRFKEKEVEKSPMSKAYVEPMVLVTSVKGKETALPNEKVKYEVTGYNISNVKDKDRKRVKWDIVVDGKQETLSLKGESIEFEMKEEWFGKSILLMPYLKKPSIKVQVKTHIQCNHRDGAKIVAEYIVHEIQTNTRSNIANSIRYYASYNEYIKRYDEWKKKSLLGQILTKPEPQNLLKAKILWTERVFAKRPWDHKPIIREKFSHLAVERTHPQTQVVYKSYYHKYKDYDYFYDVWSNIHYGYVGLSVGFDEDMLLNGADLAQIIDSKGGNVEDTNDDKTSIKIGFSLYYKYGKYAEGLTANDILEALDNATMTESKLKHVCLTK